MYVTEISQNYDLQLALSTVSTSKAECVQCFECFCFSLHTLHTCTLCHKLFMAAVFANRRNIAEESPDAVCHLCTSCRSINCRRRGGWWPGGPLSWQGGAHPVTCNKPKPKETEWAPELLNGKLSTIEMQMLTALATCFAKTHNCLKNYFLVIFVNWTVT